MRLDGRIFTALTVLLKLKSNFERMHRNAVVIIDLVVR